MIIDIHTHVADLRRPDTMSRRPVTVENLIERLDEEGIDKAVVLPLWGQADGVQFPYLFSPQPDIISQIKAVAMYPERLIKYGCLDPRMGGNQPDTDFSWLLQRFVDLGCVGIGEFTPNLPADDPRIVNVLRQCGEWDLPVLFHGAGATQGSYGLIDPVGLPRLENLLRQIPGTVLIGHGQGFWSEIGAEITNANKATYPSGPIEKEGAIPRLLRTYPNLYADISANSGYNAITRDMPFGVAFLNEFQDKVIFGSDVCFADRQGRMPHLSYLRGLLAEGEISQEVFDKVTYRNALSVMPRLG